uniref:Uncharacterized protein n=1 Tax=Cannabis sativa TaxID=3483 RepID=A0A803QTG6_CANSA
MSQSHLDLMSCCDLQWELMMAHQILIWVLRKLICSEYSGELGFRLVLGFLGVCLDLGKILKFPAKDNSPELSELNQNQPF